MLLIKTVIASDFMAAIIEVIITVNHRGFGRFKNRIPGAIRMMTFREQSWQFTKKVERVRKGSFLATIQVSHLSNGLKEILEYCTVRPSYKIQHQKQRGEKKCLSRMSPLFQTALQQKQTCSGRTSETKAS